MFLYLFILNNKSLIQVFLVTFALTMKFYFHKS